MKALIILALLGAVAGPLRAADRPPGFPSVQALAQKQRELLPIIRRDVQQPALAGQAIAESYLRSALPAIDISPSLSDAQRERVDINRWVEAYERADAARLREGAEVVLLVSAAIPVKTLKALMEQARDHGIKVAFRGVTGDNPLSFAHFRQFLMTLALERYPEIVIDPVAFERYQVSAVPALVVSLPPEGETASGCQSAGPYVLVHGDIPVRAALERVVGEAAPALAALARGHLGQGKTH